MPLLLPIAVVVVLYFAFRLRGDSSRIAALRAIVFSVTVAVITSEVLNITRLVVKPALASAWFIALVASCLFLSRTRRSRPAASVNPDRPAIHLPSHLARVDLALIAIAGTILTALGAVAIVFPRGRSAAELLVGNTNLPYGSNRLTSLCEFLFFAATIVAVTLIASRFGARRTGQLIAAIFVLTIPGLTLQFIESAPMGAVFFAVTACCFFLKAGAEPNLWDMTTVGFAFGLGLLADSLTCVYLPILLVGCMAFRCGTVRTWMLKRLPLFLILAFAINAEPLFHAYRLTGNPFSALLSNAGSSLAIKIFTNPTHFAIILICFTLLIFIRLDVADRRVSSSVLSIVVALIACSAIARWHPLGNGFPLAPLLMAAVLVGCTAERLFFRPWQVLCFAALLLLSAVPFLLMSATS